MQEETFDAAYLNEETAELAGIIIGDGNLWLGGNHYEIAIAGDSKKEMNYYENIKMVIERQFGLTPKIRVRQGAVRVIIRSKKLFYFFNRVLGIPNGVKKGKEAFISDKITANNRLLVAAIRGIFDTDGSVFVSNKKGAPNYPSIEITTTSKPLANQLYAELAKLGFRSRIRCFKENFDTYKISVNGNEMIAKWNQLIGSSNPYKKQKLEEICVKA